MHLRFSSFAASVQSLHFPFYNYQSPHTPLPLLFLPVGGWLTAFLTCFLRRDQAIILGMNRKKYRIFMAWKPLDIWRPEPYFV